MKTITSLKYVNRPIAHEAISGAVSGVIVKRSYDAIGSSRVVAKAKLERVPVLDIVAGSVALSRSI